MNTDGLHHIGLRVSDVGRSKRFYTTALGFTGVLDIEGLSLVAGHGTLLGLRGGAPETDGGDKFSPFRIGLDHLALAVSAAQLESLKAALDAAGVRNNGVEQDELTGASYIAFFDPDGIAWELYAMPA
jgi:catechol 2,3-dioxygenase-like lactoylglutathione lyase family enzyme